MSPDPMAGYDRWLEKPYQDRHAQEPPPEVEDRLGVQFYYEGEPAVVEDWESWWDADEDGPYGGIDFVIRIGGTQHPQWKTWSGGRTVNLRPGELEDALDDQAWHKPEN